MTHRKIGYFDVEGSCYVAQEGLRGGQGPWGNKPDRWRGKYVISEDGEELVDKLCSTLHDNQEDACAEGMTMGIAAARKLMKEREGFDPGDE